MSRHFDETMTILISHFLRFGALKILTGDYFVLRINQIIYSKQKIGCFIHFSIFSSTFPTAVFPFTLYRVAYKWRMDRNTYQHVNQHVNDSIISPHLCIATKGQRSSVLGYVENYFCRVSFRWWSTWGSIGTLTQLPRNAPRNFFQTHARRCLMVSM